MSDTTDPNQVTPPDDPSDETNQETGHPAPETDGQDPEQSGTDAAPNDDGSTTPKPKKTFRRKLAEKFGLGAAEGVGDGAGRWVFGEILENFLDRNAERPARGRTAGVLL